MKKPIVEMARHTLEALDPSFATTVRAGDIVVGGDNFGMGSSREQAVMTLRTLGIAAVIAKSFAGLFFRNALNLGLPALVCAEAGKIHAGDRLAIAPAEGRIENLTKKESYACEPIPPHLVEIIRDGGLLPHLEKKLKRRSA
jgi:3-isopropylmalate/(R)-2-methylmalate dehydratase small subunit